MKIDRKVFWQIIDKPDGNDLLIIRRHYCAQLNLNNLCTTRCRVDCGPRLQKMFDSSRGDFIINPKAMLVYACRMTVADLIQVDHKAETPKNELGEATPEADVFASLAKHYETTTTLG